MRRHRVLYQAASWLLDYPGPALQERLPLIQRALAEQPGPEAALAGRTAEGLAGRPPGQLQRQYVETFDLSRKHALYLSYWTDGDTRRRGEVLAGFKRTYRQSGFLADTRRELPDYLPMVLEFAALADYAAGRELLRRYRPGVELLRLALEEAESVYRFVLQAVCASLPGPSPADRQAVMALAGYGPPAEQVGLEPYDPRLLPLHGPGSGDEGRREGG
ncbi:nitrate reductase molybdenum cofactor assembly chaperone [Arthrobacter sp. I2-34]|uniref:Nitrate reductase molybdenum cofactor assembly chaperone n=1 Tax=Arthrobacter hankyongi TaxID=2904801 RepID=A0ABS9L4F5_9MICC|nr:nitrate reductase molybdenum cofactor assembly chaperone [Arthrobacter hankyongi]MCG2621548.1 nitrate reductase molybdenum cofactor assembly chaperone [Arthrobacter hankyongi]